jgi:ABC-type dipeptide/oligopeptide/nickel transport system ATPase component
MWIAMAIFGVLLSPAYFRLVYVQVRAVKAELFVDAAKVSGLGDFRIISRHVLGAVRAPVIIQTGVIASIAIAIQSGLLFLGLGDAKEPSWGSSLADGFKKMYNMPTLLAFPSLVIAITTLALAIFANTLRDEIESVDKGRKKTKAGAAVSNAPAKVEAIVHADVARDAKPKLLDVKDLAIGYPDGNGGVKQVVHGITLDIRKGEVMGLIGESGSGKTQTAFSVLGLLPKGGRLVSGSIVFDGVQLSGATAKDYDAVRGGRIAYIPQEPMSNLDPSFSIGTQLIEPMAKVLKISKREARARAVELLERVGIPNPALTMKKFPHEISGGQAQRVLIAGAVSCNPDLIIADEPTTALDVTVQAEVLDLLRDLQAERHMALLLVTHNFGVVADLCDYLNVMKDGQIVESGNVLEIFQNAKHPYTQSLLNSILEGGPARGAYVAPKGDN